MKKLLIISPYFPPSNAADMQRIRMSLPYFKDFGWQAEVVCVDEKYSEMVKDCLFSESIPSDIKIHTVTALSKRWTSKIGLGSLALRSLWSYFKFVNNLLKKEEFDLIYFSTTQFPVCILGAYWKKKHNIPYVIDMQDPWNSDYYKSKPKAEQPPKYWFSYRLNKYLEPIAMKSVDGLISVSKDYLKTLRYRYPYLHNVPSTVITFGAFKRDFEIAAKHSTTIKAAFEKENNLKHIVYVGRGGHDMQKAVGLLFTAFKKGLVEEPQYFKKIRFHFIGTSYAPSGQGKPTIIPLAESMEISDYVEEQTARVSFYTGIKTLQEADALIVPGSDDPAYTASKIYPYILSRKPLLAVFNLSSSAARIINDCNSGIVANLEDTQNAVTIIYDFFLKITSDTYNEMQTDWDTFDQYSARSMTGKQCILFDKITLNHRLKTD